jgi:uncharacterized membrane protein YphA (DoxX/SURF4 family)
MKNPLATDLSSNLGLLMARIPLGLYFALAGYAHFKTQNFATQYVAALPNWMPSEARTGYSSVLPFIEIAVGVLLIVGLTTRVGGMLAAGITALLVAGMGLSWEANPNASQYHLLMMLGLSVVLLCVGGGKFTLDNFLFNKKKGDEAAH